MQYNAIREKYTDLALSIIADYREIAGQLGLSEERLRERALDGAILGLQKYNEHNRNDQNPEDTLMPYLAGWIRRVVHVTIAEVIMDLNATQPNKALEAMKDIVDQNKHMQIAGILASGNVDQDRFKAIKRVVELMET